MLLQLSACRFMNQLHYLHNPQKLQSPPFVRSQGREQKHGHCTVGRARPASLLDLQTPHLQGTAAPILHHPR